MTIDDYFATGPEFEQPVFDAVMAGLEGVGPIHVEPVSVGIFLKRAQSFAELRPMAKWVAVSFFLPRSASHARISRKVNEYGGRYWHTANVRAADDVDDALIVLLTEAYLAAPPA